MPERARFDAIAVQHVNAVSAFLQDARFHARIALRRRLHLRGARWSVRKADRSARRP
jgi:hypothetical protein